MTHAVPIGFVVGNQHVAEDDFARCLQGFVNDRVVAGVDVADDAEDALFDVGGHKSCRLAFAEVGDVVADNGLPGQHRGRGFAAGRGERAGEVGFAAVRAEDAHDEHVLGKPAFFGRFLNRQTQGQFFQADGVAGVLGIRRDRRCYLPGRYRRGVCRRRCCSRVRQARPWVCRKRKEFSVLADFFELFIAGAVQDAFAVGDVRGIRNLRAGNREIRIRRSQAEKANQHLAAFIGILQKAFGFGQTFSFVH